MRLTLNSKDKRKRRQLKRHVNDLNTANRRQMQAAGQPPRVQHAGRITHSIITEKRRRYEPRG